MQDQSKICTNISVYADDAKHVTMHFIGNYAFTNGTVHARNATNFRMICIQPSDQFYGDSNDVRAYGSCNVDWFMSDSTN